MSKPKNISKEKLDIHAKNWSEIIKTSLKMVGTVFVTLILAAVILLVYSNKIDSIEWGKYYLSVISFIAGIGIWPALQKLLKFLDNLMKGQLSPN